MDAMPAQAGQTCKTLVVIPTLNEAQHIEGLLDTLLADDASHGDTLFVVADGYSTDRTTDIVRRIADRDPRVRLLHNPKRLQSAAINLAVQAFGKEASVLVRVDAHAQYPQRFVPRLLESLEQHQADAVVVPMDSVGDTCLRKAIAWVSDTKLGSGGSAHRGGRASGWVDHGHHAAFTMASFNKAGGYDESFSHNEDAELDCRQRSLGSRIYLDADIRVGYYPRPTLKGLWRQYFGYGRGRSRTVRKHPGSMRMRQMAVPAHLALSAMAVLAAPWAPWLLAWPALYLAIILVTSAMVAWKHKSACGLFAGPAAVVMHTAWALGMFHGLATIRQTPWRPADSNAKSNDATPLIAYFVHHAEDPAYRRRIAMFNAGQAQVLTLGFTREQPDLQDIQGARFIRLGATQAENNQQRIAAVLTALLRTAKWVPQMAHADVIIARNLECLALAVLASKWCRPDTPIHYEVLDIHRLVLREDLVGKLLRKLEAALMRRCQHLILSSPAFESQYFARFHGSYPKVVIVENKVFPAPSSRPHRSAATADRPLRIGWYGVLRCRKSLLMLKQLAADPALNIEVHLRGKVASTVIPDFEEIIAGSANIYMHGPYANPADLQRIYTEVDIAWAIDFYEEGQNSLWLLPNRLYESCLYGCVPLAMAGTQTANWLKGRQLGLIAKDFTVETFRDILDRAGVCRT